jgi:hypothetical protein
MACGNPIDFDSLVACWFGELSDEHEARIEEHLLGCADCSARCEELAAIAAGVRAVVRQGKAGMVISEPFLQAMKQAGMRLREYPVEPGGSVNCTIGADDDGVVSRLRAPLAGARQLDVVQELGEGGPEVRAADVPFDEQTGEVILIPPAAWLRSMPAFTMRMRLVSVGEAGEAALGEYTFVHSPAR